MQATIIKFNGSQRKKKTWKEEWVPGRIGVSVGEGGDGRVTESRNDQIIHIFKLSRNVKYTYIFF